MTKTVMLNIAHCIEYILLSGQLQLLQGSYKEEEAVKRRRRRREREQKQER